MNNKRLNSRSVAMMTVACLAFASCEKDDVKIKTDPIKPITVEVTTSKTTTVGDIKNNGYQLTIPAGTFDTDVTVSVTDSKSEAASAYKKTGAFTLLSSPISITVEGKEGTVWLKELVKVSFPMPTGFAVTEKNIYTIFGSFYNPDTKSIDYIYPDWNDLQREIITFTTSHFSVPAAVQAKEAEAIKKFAKDKAAESIKTEKKVATYSTESALSNLYNDVKFRRFYCYKNLIF